MAESDRDHSSEMEARLDEKHHRWLRLEEIFDVLRDPNSLISEKPAITPPSGSIFLFDKKLLKRFRKDGYEWKKTKDGKRTKEGHEKLKHLQATDATNSNSARTSEPENTVSDEDNGICDNMVDSSTIRVFSPYPSNFGYYETDPTASEEGKSKVTPNATIEEVVVMSSHERLHELDRASASNTMILVGSNSFSTDIGPMILAIFEQLEQSVLAYSEAYPECDTAKNLTEQVKATKQLLQPKVQFCDSKEREFQDLAKRKFWIESRQAAIVAEIHGAIKETEPIQAQLEKLLLQQDQFKENEDNLKTILDIGDGLWTTLKNIIHPHLPT